MRTEKRREDVSPVQSHTVQQIRKGHNEGKYVYTGGNEREGRYPECCAGTFEDEGFGHATEAEAYAHMREKLLAKLRLDAQFGNWGGCHAPVGDGICDVPTKKGAEIPPAHFLEHLCDEHRTAEVVEAMWKGPGDSYGSW